MNRLGAEQSPYLLLHADNPIHWYPWGLEAFQEAKQRDVPIFLSIGYSACHWCHAMERESFQNEEIAKLLNEGFVAVKVDREELPYIDHLYMNFASSLIADGVGWPLNLFLTSDLKPFYAVTYLPATSQQGMLGLKELLIHIREIWHSSDRKAFNERANAVIELFEEREVTVGNELAQEEELDQIVSDFYQGADLILGGMKGDLKFPLSYQLELFLNYSRLKEDSRGLYLTKLTLDQMAAGGIYDQVGGGFARYSTDAEWKVPHFEKMLYDNALLASAYIAGWKWFKSDRYKEVAEQCLDYMMRELMHPEGGFYASQDADVDGEEGKFYTWTPKELEGIVSREHIHPLFDESVMVIGRLEPQVRTSLLAMRAQKEKPLIDRKIVAGWNGLAIDAFVKGALAFDRSDYLEAALESMQFIKENLLVDGVLCRSSCEGVVKHPAVLSDYAHLIRAFLTLFEAEQKREWLQLAEQLTTVVEERFKISGGAFSFAAKEESLFFQLCDMHDGAEPSGNAVHLENLIRLYKITHNRSYLKQGDDILKVVRERLTLSGTHLGYFGLAMVRKFDFSD